MRLPYEYCSTVVVVLHAVIITKFNDCRQQTEAQTLRVWRSPLTHQLWHALALSLSAAPALSVALSVLILLEAAVCVS